MSVSALAALLLSSAAANTIIDPMADGGAIASCEQRADSGPAAGSETPGASQQSLEVAPPAAPDSNETLEAEQAASEIVVTARGDPPPGDPLQEINIQSFQLAQSVDRRFVGPIARGYQEGVPEPLRDGVGNALRNVGEPVNFLNFLLQLKIGKAAETVGRFALNSTIGVAGVFDVAKKKPFNLPYRPNGFANTLGVYGLKPGAYMYLPLIGPTTLRDMVGDGVDLLVLPAAFGKPFNRSAYAIPTTTITKLNDRVDRDADIRRLQLESSDPYVETRTLYLEMRRRDIDALRGKSQSEAEPSVPASTDKSGITGRSCLGKREASPGGGRE
ncbi:VacJ-like lipoprotein [Sphingopyxis sp. LC81]|nr:VacJ-like lipoprotein [Sphingopyxis sp. LC81]